MLVRSVVLAKPPDRSACSGAAMFLLLTFLYVDFACCSPAGDAVGNRMSLPGCRTLDAMVLSPRLEAILPKQPVNDTAQTICNNEHVPTCCTPEVEKELLNQVRSDFRSLMHHSSRSVEALLANTARMVEEHVVELARQSENKTLSLFHQVYQTMAVLSTEPIRKLYADVVHHGTENRERTDVKLQMELAVLNFFTDLFPLVYHHAINPRLRDYSDDYKRCLRTTMLEIRPFGEVPKELGEKVGKTIKGIKVFLDALAVGAEVLNKTDALFDSSAKDKCHEELLRMSYCPKCRGLRTKPCAGYCLNVLRGCLTHLSTQLDLPWTGYVDSLRDMAGNDAGSSQLLVDLEDMVRSLDTKISGAIMNAMVNGPQLEEKVKRACGAPQWSDDDEQPLPVDRLYDAEALLAQSDPGRVKVTPHISNRKISEKLKESEKQLTQQLRHFLSTIAKTRTFYANMAESLCSDESFAETRDTADCWEGHRIGEYTKIVVAASLNAQKYNPELVLVDEVPDMQVRQLSEKLRSVKTAILGVLAPPIESDMFLRDEEGSGSGYSSGKARYPDDDDDDETNEEEGSGSGDSAIETFRGRNGSPSPGIINKKHPISEGSYLRFSRSLSILLWLWWTPLLKYCLA